jgi:cytochrome c-type biogenesis protein CcmH/NrfF
MDRCPSTVNRQLSAVNPIWRVGGPFVRVVLCVFVAISLAAPLAAQAPGGRSPQEAERLYHEVGGQFFCLCGGCRDKLLECSHNVCASKNTQRAYLRRLTEDPNLDAAGIKREMVTRFGERVLVVPQSSSLYPVLIVVAVLLIGAFGLGMRNVVRRGRSEPKSSGADESSPAREAELEERIRRDLEDMD